MKKLRLIPIAIGIVVSFVACDKDDDDDDNAVYNQQDRNFAMMAAMNNFAEIDAGQAAATKGANPGIKQYGAMIVADHTVAGQELKSVTTGLGLYSPDSLDARHVALKAQLAQLTGRAFDSVYIHAQVEDHESTIELFEDEVNDGKQQDLKTLANNKLPVLRMHLQHADSLANLYRR